MQQNYGADHDRDHDCSTTELALQTPWLFCSLVFLFLKGFSNFTEFSTHKESNNRVESEKVIHRVEGKEIHVIFNQWKEMM